MPPRPVQPGGDELLPASTDTRITVMATRWTGRVSAVGPAFSRRRNAAGCSTASYGLGIKVTTVNAAMKTHPCR